MLLGQANLALTQRQRIGNSSSPVVHRRLNSSCSAHRHPCGQTPGYRWSSRSQPARTAGLRVQAAATQSSRDDEDVVLLPQPVINHVDEVDTPEGLADVQTATESSRGIGDADDPPTFQAAASAELGAKEQQAAQQGPLPNDSSDDLLSLCYAVATGAIVATCVFLFDCSIQYIHDLPDIFAADFHLGGGRATGLELLGYSVPFRSVPGPPSLSVHMLLAPCAAGIWCWLGRQRPAAGGLGARSPGHAPGAVHACMHAQLSHSGPSPELLHQQRTWLALCMHGMHACPVEP
jgi:hypothetical protein